MSNAAAVIYSYDGTFDGLLCCVFESYTAHELPTAIIRGGEAQLSLLPMKEIVTLPERAERVKKSIPEKMGSKAYELVRKAYLTEMTDKELYILKFLRLGYKNGKIVIQLLTNEVVSVLLKAVQHLESESHLLKGFIRFAVYDKVMVSEIGPKNIVLPLLVNYFAERYPDEQYLIYDKLHQMALVHDRYGSRIIPLAELELPAADVQELEFRRLWRTFHQTIEIKERHNPRCQMTLMPKRYWQYMTEFAAEETAALPIGRDDRRRK